MNINDIFTIEQYDEAYQFVSTHKYTTIEDLGDGTYQIVDIKPTPEEEEQAEKERISHLYLTRADVERGLYKALDLDFDDILAMVMDTQSPIDVKGLKIELNANNFYRGNEYVNAIGIMLGLTKDQLDKFFEYNDYRYLIPERKDEDIDENRTSTTEPTVPNEVQPQSIPDNEAKQ